MTLTQHPTAEHNSSQTASGESFVVQSLGEMLASHRGELEDLFQRTPNPHPCLHPGCLAAQFADTPDVVVAALQDNGHIVCAAILTPWSLSAGKIPRTRLTWKLHGRRVFGKGLLWDGNPDVLRRWLTQLPAHLQQQCWAGLMIEALASDTLLSEAISTTLTNLQQFRILRPSALAPRWRIELPSTVDEYWTSQFKGKTRNTLRRKRKKLGDYRVDVYTEPDQVGEFLQAATTVSEQTWQSRQLGLRVKSDDQEQRLFSALAERSEFRGHVMWLDQRPVAFVINTSHDGYLHYEETGFLPELSHLSPGTVLVSELIDDVIRSGEYHTVDFGLGHADYKQLFSNRQTQSADIWLLRNNPVTALAALLISGQDTMREAAKRVLQRSGVLRRLKKPKRRK